jgi:hypothetical protein
MPNLLVEYLKRHKYEYVPLCHNGVCFFDGGSPRNHAIALTSLACRSFSTCTDCDREIAKSTIIVEMFTMGYNGSFAQVFHKHMPQNTDLTALVNKYALYDDKPLKPIYAKSQKELEVWLWKFLIRDLAYKPKETKPEMLDLEPIAWAAFKNPKLYASYYMAYEAFLVNRKYLLLDA